MRALLILSLALLSFGLAVSAGAAPCVADAARPTLLRDCETRIDAAAAARELGQPVLAALEEGNWYRIDAAVQGGDELLDLGLADAYEARVYLIQGGTVHRALELDTASVFADRPFRNRKLIAPLATIAGPAQIIVYYRAHTRMPMSARLLDANQMIADDNLANVFNGLIFGFMLAVAVTLAFGFKAQRQTGFRLYGAVVVMNTLFVAQIEGYPFAFLWGGSPDWNMRAAGVIGMLVVMTHIAFAVNFLQMKQGMRRLYRLHQVMFGIAALSLLLHLMLAHDKSTILVAIAYTLLGCASAFQGVRQNIEASRFYLAGSLMLASFPLLLLVFAVFQVNPLPQISLLAYPRFGYFGEALMFGAAVVSQINQFNARQAEQRLMRLAETEQLLRAEHSKRAALEMASEQQLRLAAASHDIAQPLASLRFAVTALKQQHEQGPLTEHIDHTLQYAQALLGDLIGQTRRESDAAERIELGNMLAQLNAAFSPAAAEKGLHLSVRECRLALPGSPTMLYRILTNLVANAVRHTGKGRILLGARRKASGIEILVYDTGPGIPPAMQKKLLEPFRQGCAGEGYGLGLFIVKNLCEHCHYALRIRSVEGRGSCFAVFIPLAAPV